MYYKAISEGEDLPCLREDTSIHYVSSHNFMTKNFAKKLTVTDTVSLRNFRNLGEMDWGRKLGYMDGLLN